jgi:hypothetical protein
VLAVAVAGFALWRAGGRSALALAALGLALVVIAIPLRLQRQASSAPPIHDITTDTANPPALAPLRAGSRNPLDYSQEVARQQREHANARRS